MNTIARDNRSAFSKWFLFALCVIQPLLDVLSYWMNALGYGTDLTLAIRFLLLAATMICAVILSEKRHCYWILFGILFVLAGLHVFACVRASGICGGEYSLAAAVIDLTNFGRVAQLPLFTLAFITFLKNSGEDGYRSAERAMVVNFAVILLVELISAVTGTNPYTYPNKSIGLLGWFYFANSQSAILSMLVPLVICTAMKTGKFRSTLLAVVLGFSVLWLFATRLSYLAIFVIAFGTILVWAVNRKLDKKSMALILLSAILCAGSFPVSPMVKNQRMVAANAVKKQQIIDTLVARGVDEFGENDDRRLLYAYEKYLGPLVDKYGFETVVQTYHASSDVSQLADVRLKRLNFCRLMRSELPTVSRLFGLNYCDMEYEGDTFDVENDFHGVLYLYGYAGLACLGLFFAFFLGLIVWALTRDFKRYFTVDAGACGIALCLGLVHAYATAGVLRRPNATVYLSLVLAMIWFLVRAREYNVSKEGSSDA